MMTSNPILEELYAIREKLLADSGGDLQTYLAGVREREAASGRLLKQGGGSGAGNPAGASANGPAVAEKPGESATPEKGR